MTTAPLARSHQKLLYSALMRCAAQSVLELAANERFLGARPAILAVLHTSGRDLTYHPHVHLLVSAGGLSSDGRFLFPRQRRFLMPARMLSVLLRNKLRAAVRRADLYDLLSERARNAFDTPWVVHAQHAAHGHRALTRSSRSERSFLYRRVLHRATHAIPPGRPRYGSTTTQR